MTSTKPTPRFQVGDRVIHKPSPFGQPKDATRSKHRAGVVMAVSYKKNKRGATQPWFTIKFDNSERMEQFMSARIAPEENN